MIENDQQLLVTQTWLVKFEAELVSFDDGEAVSTNVDPLIRQAYRDSIASIVAEMRVDVAEYEARRKTN